MTQDTARGALAGSDIHDTWVSLYRTPEAQGFYELAFDAIVHHLAPTPGAVILDAGCGSCAKSVLLSRRGLRVVATDFSSEALARAAKTVEVNGQSDRITLKQGDLLNLPFRDGEFSYAICWGVLMHVPQVERAIAELARVVAPGGALVLSEGNVRSVQAVTVNTLKRLLGRGRGRIVRTAAGLETHEETAQGALVTRQTDMRWLSREVRRHGLHIERRMPGQFTELYVVAPWRWLRTLIHAVNYAWFTVVRRPGPAYANILIFRKSAGAGR